MLKTQITEPHKSPKSDLHKRLTTAANAGLVACSSCHKLLRLPQVSSETKPHTRITLHCSRCHERLHSRIPASLSETWAYLIAAAIFFIPANMLPVMTVVMLGKGQPDTIMSGVLHLIEGGMWPLALIVFVASIFVPLLKLLVLSGLLLSIHLKTQWRPLDRTRLYRITEFVGRWSMVDIFVIAILVALVQFGALADVEPNAGSLSFAAVVVLTMFAAHRFDPRLIWDEIEHKQTEAIQTSQSKTKGNFDAE